MRSYPLLQNTFILRRPGVAIFAYIIKIITRFIKIFSKDSRKVKRIRNYVPKWNLYLYFLIKKYADFPWKNADVSRTESVSCDSCFFAYLL